ncbi:MAG: hypothetical protein GXP49_14040 [Deltaproteobacteria bacterium]|nr:hypothetical protein [Deltaproteobacteria bacterium]
MKLIKILVFLAAVVGAVYLGARYLPGTARSILKKGESLMNSGKKSIESEIRDKDRKQLDKILRKVGEKSK